MNFFIWSRCSIVLTNLLMKFGLNARRLMPWLKRWSNFHDEASSMIRGDSKRLPSEHPVFLVFEAVGRHYRIGRNELLCRAHNGQRHARHMAFFMLSRLVNMSNTRMAHHLGNNHSSISYG